MRHYKKNKKLGRNLSQRSSLELNLVKSFFIHNKITTTEVKAKNIKPVIEKLITLAKKEDLHAKRLIKQKVGSYEIVKKIIETAKQYQKTQGGYTKIIKITRNSPGDNSPIAILTLI